MKSDPKYVAAARELRDQFLEQINSTAPGDRMLPGAQGKYDVSRQLAPGERAEGFKALPLPKAA